MRFKPLSCLITVAVSVMVCTSCAPGSDHPVAEESDSLLSVDETALEQFMSTHLEEHHIPGLAVAIVDTSGVLFSAGYGWADIDGRVTMTPDTILNVASISKTVTNAAVLQLRDQGLLALDDDVNGYLPFSLRHPSFPEAEITVRQLLTHTSGIRDGAAYDASYACGDPAVSLEAWVRGYLEIGGTYYDPDQNFLATAPGEASVYSNVAFGLLGYLVETVSGVSFADYVETHVFEPLGMNDSGWYLSGIDTSRHAIPYTWIEGGKTLDNALFAEARGRRLEEPEFVPFCLYSFFNIPDGLLRTSVHDLAMFLLAHMRGGELEGRRILASSTVDEIFTPQLTGLRGDGGRWAQGLTWRRRSLDFGDVWGHGGADPGVRTRMVFSPEENRGAIVFSNGTADLDTVLKRLLDEAFKARSQISGSE